MSLSPTNFSRTPATVFTLGHTHLPIVSLFLSSLEVHIVENQPLRSLVATVMASDHDLGPDGIIDYTITAGNTDGYFAISGMGFGEVVVQRTPINPHTYPLVITASDRGSPPRTSNASLVVHVVPTSNIDCNAPNYRKL